MKKYFLMLVAIATFALTSCGGDKKADKDSDSKSKSGKSAKSDKSDKENVVDVEDADEAPAGDVVAEPTGDMDADIKTLVELNIESLKAPSAAKTNALKATQDAFKAYYDAKGQGDEWDMNYGLTLLSNEEMGQLMDAALKNAKF